MPLAPLLRSACCQACQYRLFAQVYTSVWLMLSHSCMPYAICTDIQMCMYLQGSPLKSHHAAICRSWFTKAGLLHRLKCFRLSFYTQFMRLDFDYSSSLLTGLLTVPVALLTSPFACRYSMSPVKALQVLESSGRLECYGSSKSSSTSRCYSCNHAKHFSAFARDQAAILHYLHTSAEARYSCSWQIYIHATICDLLFSPAQL